VATARIGPPPAVALHLLCSSQQRIGDGRVVGV
jgi:hypothetical protein